MKSSRPRISKGTAIATSIIGLWAGVAFANTDAKDLLVKFKTKNSAHQFAQNVQTGGARIENLGVGNWVRLNLENEQFSDLTIEDIRSMPNVESVQPNYKLHLLEDYRTANAEVRKTLLKMRALHPNVLAAPDNPPIPDHGSGGTGEDPLYAKQWGMNDIGAKNGWQKNSSHAPVVVAVIDTGVDYTHEDLVDQLWRNPGESGKDAQGRDKASNAIDDDANGFIDDVIGWDFVSNDNKPFDLAVDPIQILLGGGNPGHGTHCAGNVAAAANNGKGIAGVAPEAKIMALRFLSEKGEGNTADAVKAINYAVKNGAKVLSNSWGSEGEDPSEAAGNQALKDAITNAQKAGVIFIAAAGNGHSGVGYDNDTDAKPGIPASYKIDNIISVAAIDANNNLGAFSNWGRTTVHIAAPGVKVFSTTVGNNYSDMVIDMLGVKASWDGTSMAAPHVAGAAALYLSKHPTAGYKEVKDAILATAKPITALSGKSVTGGKLDVDALMSR